MAQINATAQATIVSTLLARHHEGLSGRYIKMHPQSHNYRVQPQFNFNMVFK